MRYFLGIDNGGTVTKAAIYTAAGEEMGVASTSTGMITPQSGFTERDMEAMWRANIAVIRDVLKKTGVRAGDIAGIACCGHGKGLYLWGDGKPAMNGIISTDNRAWRIVRQWDEDGTAQKAYALTCQKTLACQPVALLSWLKQNDPAAITRAKWVFECKDYVRFRLTGEARAERTDYSGTSLMNLLTESFDDRLLEIFDICEIKDKLPPLCNSADICGRVTREAALETGLKEGTPVAGGMFDIDACLLSTGAIEEDTLCMIAGTWSINEYIATKPVVDGSVMLNSLFCLPGWYVIEESSPTSAGNNEWLVNTLLPEWRSGAEAKGELPYELINGWVESVDAGEFCPLFTPFVMGSNDAPNARASFVGLSGNHTRAHIWRGVYEGVALSHRKHAERLFASKAKPVRAIRLAGGAARSRVWTQIFADVLQLPVEVVDVNETGTMGCAMAAAVAAGEYADFQQAASAMVRVMPAVMPDPAKKALYDAKYALYLKVNDALRGVWDDIDAL